MKQKQQVLFYGFQNEEKREKAEHALHSLGIATRVLPEDAWHEKVGYLLGMKGFRASKRDEEEMFSFPHEVMILQNVRGKRLDEVLARLKEYGVEHIPYKSVVTPFNTLWTLKRLCETMQKEHAYMADQEEKKAKKQGEA